MGRNAQARQAVAGRPLGPPSAAAASAERVGGGRPTVALIDEAALRHNLLWLRSRLRPGVGLLAVVKADAYGHGARLVGPVLERVGADLFGVATVEEGVELREAGIRRPIVVLAGATAGEIPAASAHGLEVAVVDAGMVRDLARAAGPERLRVHVKVDTGMGRLGVRPEALPGLLLELERTPGVSVTGIFTHLASAEDPRSPEAEAQLQTFRRSVAAVRRAGLAPRWIHMANSAATVLRPEMHWNLVRPGIALYGVGPAGAAGALKPVMRLATRILQLKDVPAGAGVSYDRTFVTSRRSRLAVLPIGYADGYDRRLSNRGAVLVRGRRAPVVGRVCMDLTVVDVTDVPGVRPGDEVVLWGRQDGAALGVDEVAAWEDTIVYEVLTRLGSRVPRVLVRDGGR